MAWITEQQAELYLRPNPEWDALPDKDNLLQLASNRLEQLVFKDEPVHRVEDRYLDGNSLTKLPAQKSVLLEAEAGNWDYHAALGWTRSQDNMELFIYTGDGRQVVFINPDRDGSIYTYQQSLILKEIQSLHSFGGTFGGRIALDAIEGGQGLFSAFETQQANAIVDSNGDQVFFGSADRRINAAYTSVDLHVAIKDLEGTTGITLDGVSTIEVIDELGNTITSTAPAVLLGDYFDYKLKIINGLDNTMFLYVEDILVGNPTFDFNSGGKGGNRLLYTSGSSAGVDRVTYIRTFGAVINVENPLTIPVRLVGACALLALEYGKFPPTFIGDKEYLENENDYNRMQDLPVNVQAAVEPFLADYESVVDIDGVATTAVRGMTPKEDRKAATSIQYSGDSATDTNGTPDTPEDCKCEEGDRGPRGPQGKQGIPGPSNNFSRLNSYLPLASPYTTPALLADTPTKLLIPTTPITTKDFSFDAPNLRWFFDKLGATNIWFNIHLVATITTSLPNRNVTIEMYKNGILQEAIGSSRFMSVGSDQGIITASAPNKFNHNDYIEIYVTLSGAGTITFERLSIGINEMVGAI
jgi:hypothetical protein